MCKVESQFSPVTLSNGAANGLVTPLQEFAASCAGRPYNGAALLRSTPIGKGRTTS